MTSFGRILPIGLFLILSVLCTLIGFEITNRTREQQPDLPARVAEPVSVDTPSFSESPNQHDAWFKDIVARPLFSPDRRPAASSVHTVAGLPRLTGIVVAGSKRIAIFAANSGGRPIVAEAGSHIGVYNVRDVTDGGVTVVGPEGTTIIRPIFDAAPATLSKPPLTVRPELPKPATK